MENSGTSNRSCRNSNGEFWHISQIMQKQQWRILAHQSDHAERAMENSGTSVRSCRNSNGEFWHINQIMQKIKITAGSIPETHVLCLINDDACEK
jgi:RecA/RadA recombinase